MKVILTEKPSVARDIASHVGAKQRQEGYFEGNGYQVTWAFGHLICLKEPEEYDPALKKWRLENLPFIPQPFELKVAEDRGVRKQFNIIKKLLKSAAELICATDAGREGELIFRYILAMTQWGNRPWKRLWLSSLTDEALQAGFKHLRMGHEFDHLYAAAKCRSQADWIVGINATRNMTVRYGRPGLLWSIGRVQTPVLAMIVKRDDEIRYFISEPFWEVCTKYREVEFKLKGKPFKSASQAQALLAKVRDFPFSIIKVDKKQETELPPLLYDLTELQRDMNRRLGLSAADTLQAAQALYEQKLITYPRTDSRYLPSDMKEEVLRTLQKLKSLKSKEMEALQLNLANFPARLINDKKVSDHYAIIPTGKLPSVLPSPLKEIYEAIVIRLICAFYPPCLKEHTLIEGQANHEIFATKGLRMINPGWRMLYAQNEKNADKAAKQLPLFQVGESGPHAPFISEGKTNPPAHYSENTLLGAMETAGKGVEDELLKEALKEKGLGTPATRASIIETLIRRNYIQRSGKMLKATDSGRFLIALIQEAHLKSPELTGEWEAKLKQIEQGKFCPQTFMQHIIQFTSEAIKNSDLSQLNYAAYGCCPQCNSPIIKGKKGYGCSKWREGCQFVLWSEYKGTQLLEEQVRALLQKKILLTPINGHILMLSDKGEIREIPQPVVQDKKYPSLKFQKQARTPYKPKRRTVKS